MREFLDFISFEPWTFAIMIINVFILYLLLRKFLFRPVTNMLEARDSEIRKLYDAAERDKTEAESSKKIYASKLQEATGEREKIIAAAVSAAKIKELQIIQKASDEAASITLKAALNSENIQKRALESVKGELAIMAVEIAKKITQKEIDPKTNEALIEEFINDLDGDLL
jgi:F-type H+-transporting ATPase subunit b